MTNATDTYAVHPPHARWTHVALRVTDIDASIAWYTQPHSAETAGQAVRAHRLRRLAGP